MNIVVTCYLYGALLVYLVTGGADFGAGILELFTPAHDKKYVREVMHRLTSPIWEADHMWLILAVVILFVGFPDLYAQISTAFFIPVSVLLLGIMGRGTSYAFRNADNVRDRFKTADNVIYISSSIVAPFCLGVVASALFSARPAGGQSFADAYLFNWFNYFSFSVGLLTVMFCGYLAIVYTLCRFPGERQRLKFQFRVLSIFFFTTVILVSCNPVFTMVFNDRLLGIPLTVIIILLTAIILYLTGKLLYSRHSKWARLFAGLPVLFTLMVLFDANRADAVTGGFHLPINTNPDFSKTTDALGWTLIISTFLIVPSLGYLLYKFELPHYKQTLIGETPINEARG